MSSADPSSPAAPRAGFVRRLFRRRRVHTPTVLQMEAVECGAAALSIVMSYHGRFESLEVLRRECGVSRDGSKASNILRAARQYGFDAHGYRKEPADLREMTPPFVVFWNLNHFLVVEGFGRSCVYLNDPAVGRRTVSHEDFDGSFTGVVLTVEPGPEFRRGGRPYSLWRALAGRLAGSRVGLAFVILATLGLVVPGLVIPVFSQVFVDKVLVAGLDAWVRPLLLGMGLTALARFALTWLQQHYLLRVETRLALTSSARFLWHVFRLPMEFYTQRYAGDLANRVASNDKVAQLLSGQLATAVVNTVSVAFYAVLLYLYDPVLTGISVGLAALNFVALRWVARRRRDANRRLLQDQGKLLSTAMNGLVLIETVKACGGEDDLFARWAGYQAKVAEALQRLGSSSALLDAVPPFISAAANVVVLCVGGVRVMDGLLSIGMLVAYQSLLASFLQPIGELVRLGGQLQEVDGDVKRLDDVFHYDLDPRFGVAPASGATARLEGRLELRDVTFGYSRLDPPLIKNFTLTVETGRRVALVGGSGSGKSTVANLAAGLYSPWSGEVLFDGKPRERIPSEVMRASVAMVNQDIFLFAGTVRENLTLWDPTVPDDRIVRASRDACIHDVVAGRPGAYDGPIEEGGGNFSGGQRQRLEIARALVSDPSVVLLDEATSALDSEVEAEIDANLRRRGCTCLIVAHRLSTIRDCDEIIVLERGEVVQRGTHEELVAAGGAYAKLIHAG